MQPWTKVRTLERAADEGCKLDHRQAAPADLAEDVRTPQVAVRLERGKQPLGGRYKDASRRPWLRRFDPANRTASQMANAIFATPMATRPWAALEHGEPIGWATRQRKLSLRLKTTGLLLEDEADLKPLLAPAIAVYVHPHHRRRGLGRRLFKAATRNLTGYWLQPQAGARNGSTEGASPRTTR